MTRVEGHYSDDLIRQLEEEADGHKGEDGRPLWRTRSRRCC